MPRNRRRKSGSDAFLDVLPQLVGLVVLAAFFVPGLRQLLGAFFVLAVGLAALGLVTLIVRAFWRRRNEQTGEATLSIFRPAVPEAPRRGWTIELLRELEWKRFEDVVAAYSRELGYEAKTTRIGADGGVDVQLFSNGQPHPVMIVQCKAWDAYKVGVKPVRELFGVMAADKVGNGAFFTTGEFTAEAEQWARGKNLDLVNGREFLSRILQLVPAARQKLLDEATEGDFATPTCPSCGVKMVVRTARTGSNSGSDFWGCPNFAKGCKRTFKIALST
jgi:restriction system protein